MVTHANVLWKLELNDEWCNSDAKACLTAFPLNLSEIIEAQRPGPNQTWTIKVGASSEKVDLVVDYDTVSSVHAEFEQDGDSGDLYVKDLNSTNGTFVNQHMREDKVHLNPGDTVSFGNDVVFTVTRDTKAHA